MEKNIEIIKDKDDILAIIVYNDYKKDGLEFLTPGDFPQQMAFISYKKGKTTQAHIHNIVKREVSFSQETLFIKKGKIKFNIYDKGKKYFDSRILETGDIIFLANGGHGNEVLEDTEMIEVRQGPYLGEKDKTRFKGIEKI